MSRPTLTDQAAAPTAFCATTNFLQFNPAELDALVDRAASGRGRGRVAGPAPAGWRVGDPADPEAHRARWPAEHEPEEDD